jgi:hypothetical protein
MRKEVVRESSASERRDRRSKAKEKGNGGNDRRPSGMKRWSWMIALVALAGLAAAPTFAEMRLTTTGFIDSHVRYADNLTDDDVTDDSDDEWRARTRARIFFNVAVNDFSKAVVGFEIDQVWGETPGSGTAGFDFGTDNIAVEVKWAYVDINLPNTPVSFRVGGLPLQADRLKNSCLLLCMDVGGIDVEVAFSSVGGEYLLRQYTGR